jgi:hypothetical protein
MFEKGKVDECLLTMDYKMKQDPKYHRETQQDWFGKRGVSWHGIMIQFCTTAVNAGTRVLEMKKIYLDQIIENENKQDRYAVFSLLEAA